MARAAKQTARSTELAAFFRQTWQRRNLLTWLLWPLSLVYRLLLVLHQLGYRWGWRRSQHPGVAVVVVGNVVVGGGGKTPVVMALVRHLQARGWHPGVIARGYGRKNKDCRIVQHDSTAAQVGDEPLLIAHTCGVPVAVARQRFDAARALLAQYPDTNVIVCDDGLQHWALARDVTVCVFNDQGVGNGCLLPAGPLREPWPRSVDCVVYAGDSPPPPSAAPQFPAQRQLAAYAQRSDGSCIDLSNLPERPLIALAAIARPEDFFQMLRSQGLSLAETIALPDHFDFVGWQAPSYTHILLCTEKDAAKIWHCYPDALAVPLQVKIALGFFTTIDHALTRVH